jgi:hypothetical protein
MPLLILPKNSDVLVADKQLNSLVCIRYNFIEGILKFSDLSSKDVAIANAESGVK